MIRYLNAMAWTAVLTVMLGAALFASPRPCEAAAGISPDIEVGRLEASYLSDPRLIKDPKLDQLLTGIATKIAAANPDAATLPVRVRVLRDALPYAFVLDNGALFVSTGLLGRLANETQLAGLIAAPVAALVRHDAQSSRESLRDRALRNFLPDLVFIAASVGLAGRAIDKSTQNAKARLDDQLQAASDAVALHWLAQAGYDPREVPRGVQRLLDDLTAEQRFGSTEFANAAALGTRVESFTRGLPADLPAQPAAAAASWWRPYARWCALDTARKDLSDGHSVPLHALLDEIDADDGPTGETALLRAQWLRQTETDSAQLPEVIAAYETAAAFSNPPVTVFKELGFLYRRQNIPAQARSNFEHYLKLAPQAPDAAIIQGYIEALQ